MQVIKNSDSLEKFKPIKIKNKIIKETGLNEDTAQKITNSVVNTIRNHFKDSISTSTIRSLINSQLVKRGLVEAELKSRKLGMSVQDFEDLVNNGNHDNANIPYNPEMITKYAYDSIAKEYALLNMPKEIADTHKAGLFHIHDLEFYNTRPNCMNYDLRFFARNGLKIDGKGDMGAVSAPAKSLEVLLNHMLQAWMAGATVFSGGQGYVNFNTLLAPYAKDRDYKDIKQCIQGFIFNCNQILVCRGGQQLFSSISLDLSCPEPLKDKPAICPDGIIKGTYSDYKHEADLILRAVLEVSNEKDGEGAYFRFPNILLNIRNGDMDEYTGNARLVHEMSANNPTLYYVNCTDLERTVMGALTLDTPVMTDKGFKYPNELKIGDTVMTYAPDGSKEWNSLYNIIEKDIPNKVFKITCENNYSFKVTENHKLPTNKGIIKSEDLKIGDKLYNYIDKRFEPTDDLYWEFVGIFLADGFIRHKPRHQTNGNNIEFHFRKQWKINNLLTICNQLGFNYTIKERKDGSTIINVREKFLRDKLVRLYDDDLKIKKFPNNIWDNKNKIANVLKGLMYDANIIGNSFVWSCSDKELVYDVCYAISYLGYELTVYKDIRKGSTDNWRTNYRITFGKDYKPINSTKIKSIELVDNSEPVYDLSVENNANYVCGLGGIHSENCRTANPMNYSGDYEKDCMNTGNFSYITLNLELLALESKNQSEFFEGLDDLLNLAYKSIHHRRSQVIDVIYNKHLSDFLLQKDKETDLPLYDIDRTSLSIGFAGLHEALVTLGYTMGTQEYDFVGKQIVFNIEQKVKEFRLIDGLRWGVIGSPAESTAGRFGAINKSNYPCCEVQGKEGSYYVTNSHHLPVKSTADFVDQLHNAKLYHPMCLAGCIFHIWSGEVWSDPKAIYSLNKKIIEAGVIFFAYSKVFTFCRKCGFTINSEVEICPKCDSKDLRVYDRITGYYLPVDTFCDSKKNEKADRFRHKI